MSPGGLTHLDAEGNARMVDVGAKPVTERRAVARARVRMSPATAAAILANTTPKAEALTVARIAGIQAAKRTGELIPLCHPLPLTFADVEARVAVAEGLVEFIAQTHIAAQTGIEMEAMTAASVAALTLYDMVKGLERGVRIEEIVLLEKSGGASGTWRREDPATPPAA
ncbi:MAG TPA: cyclic pyranopterin monophosphate synthase MoaC [Solirubrobacteraceae bacterium]|nr:cyclic pyranopterin monophosphate synthase MoaC [Solirubrobacteraceae bacterium]